MRTFLSVLLVLFVGGVAYAYLHNPVAYAKLCHDLVNVFTETSPSADTPPPQSVVAPHPATIPATNAVAVAPAPSPAPAPVITPAPEVSTQTAAATPPPPPIKKWTPPAAIPAQPHWTWTTDDKTYQDVVINQIDSTTVTITHSTGVAHIDIAALPADVQKQLNYDPEIAAAARDEAKAEEWTTDYQAALSLAKAQKKRVLLDFTGSDWCGYCQLLDKEVFTQPSFKEFSGKNYILVTVDFPHQTELSSDLKQQNDTLKKQFTINGYPTLIVLDADGKELGRSVGYDPGSGPDAVIATLQNIGKN